MNDCGIDNSELSLNFSEFFYGKEGKFFIRIIMEKKVINFAWGFWVVLLLFFYLDNDVFIGNVVGYELRKPLAVEYTVGVCLFTGGVNRT